MQGLIIIGDETRSRLKKVQKYAEDHILTIEDMKDLILNKVGTPYANENHLVEIPLTTNLYYTVETSLSGVVYKHYTIVDKRGIVPLEIARTIFKELGLSDDFENILDIRIEKDLIVHICCEYNLTTDK